MPPWCMWSAFFHMLIELVTQQILNGKHVLLQILIFWLSFIIWPGLASRSCLDRSGCQPCRLSDLAPSMPPAQPSPAPQTPLSVAYFSSSMAHGSQEQMVPQAEPKAPAEQSFFLVLGLEDHSTG